MRNQIPACLPFISLASAYFPETLSNLSSFFPARLALPSQ